MRMSGASVEDSSALLSDKQLDISYRKTKKIVVIGIAIAFIMVLMSVIITISVAVLPKSDVQATSQSTVIPQDLPKDPFLRAQKIQELFPLIDGHNDLPWRYRELVNNAITEINLRKDWANTTNYYLNTDIPRLREGRVGGQFWSVYIPCEGQYKDAVRAVMEQIDVVYRMVQLYPDVFQLAFTSSDIKSSFRNGKIASLIGMEGGHSIDSSLGALRMFYTLGARYMTLTHSCNTPWAECAQGPVLTEEGLTEFGKEVVLEMNRLGMMVDISHVSASAMRTVLGISKAPIIFSHSCAYALCPVVRNVPDDVLEMLPQNGGVVMINFYNAFVNCSSTASLAQVADHIDYVKNKAGIDHVGLGSDYDGVSNQLPTGLGDVSKYVDLTAELYKRNYTDEEVVKVIGGNVLRVLEEVEKVASQLQSVESPSEDIIDYDFVNDTCRVFN